MDVGNLEEKLCKGVDVSGEDDGFSKIEKVVAPFMRTLKKRNHEKADVLPTEYEELYLKKNTNDLLERLKAAFTDSLELRTIFNETAELLKVVTKSKSVNLYLADYDSMEILLCPKLYQNNPRFHKKYRIGTYLAAYVAFSKEYVISSDILGDVRFPQGIPDVPVVKSVICLPIITNAEENCLGVIELYRECSDRPYDLINLQICNALTAWMGIALEQNKIRLRLSKEQEINRQLSELVDLYFSGIAPFIKILSEFIKVAKIAVNAEKGAFYVFREPVPHNCQESLWADAYEEGLDENNETVLYKRRDRLKFMPNKPGIPGYAARSGDVVNIQDAYKDYRFDRKTDSPFYRTRSIVAIPIQNDIGVLGVLTLANSLSFPFFQKEDIELIRSFSCYLNLVCGYFFLENNLTKTTLRLIVTDKILDYHLKPNPEELNIMKSFLQVELTFPLGFFRFEWEYAGNDEDILKAIAAVFTHSAILDSVFESQHLADFILRIKKCYRPVPYHNFEHAVYVLHFTFNIILKNKDVYTTDEIIAILLTAFCHDIDHSGFTNGFLTLKNDTIYKLHGEYCGEAHRYEFLSFLIQQTDLLSNLPDQSYQAILKTIKRLMLAFDLALHFQNRQKIINLLNLNEFNWEDPEHRFLSQTMILICSDHSINFKVFDVVRKNTVQFYKELQKQGELEKSMGFSPLPMLNKSKNDTVPQNQSIYLTLVVEPCVGVLIRLFPNLSVLKELIDDTVSKWDELVLLSGREVWRINQAVLRERKDRKIGHRVTLVSTLSSIKTIVSDLKSDRF